MVLSRTSNYTNFDKIAKPKVNVEPNETTKEEHTMQSIKECI